MTVWDRETWGPVHDTNEPLAKAIWSFRVAATRPQSAIRAPAVAQASAVGNPMLALADRELADRSRSSALTVS
jgi:hypothetical protein